MNKQVEILAPAGSPESLKAAVCAGADAVYVGGTRFGARAYAKNLAEEELADMIDYVHIHGRKIYLTVNTLLKNQEMDELYSYLLPYYKRGLDGVIVQDTGCVGFIREHFPGLALHASTQMTITGALGAEVMKEQGVVRIVPARELTLDEIRQMKKKTGLELECFIHGALCYCYSGQCLLSSMIGGRSGNRGQCAQPCRLSYSVEGKKPADIMSLKDLCTIDMIPELIEAGIDSFKIEGRMKQPDYVYTVVSLYRKYVDLYLNKGRSEFKVAHEDRERLMGAYQRRGYSEGYYHRHNGKEMISFERPEAIEEKAEFFPEIKIKEKINGKLILSRNKSAKLFLEYKGYKVVCEGAAAEEAKKQPLDISRVEKQMKKTGNSEFEFSELEIEMDDGVFLPMQALNELRRQGICKLEAKILEGFWRQEYCKSERLEKENPRRTDAPEVWKARLSCLVQTEEQLHAAADYALSKKLSVIYIDSAIGLKPQVLEQVKKVRESGRCFLAMPYIFRTSVMEEFEGEFRKAADCYDGVLIRNFESLRWLIEQGYEKEIRSDYNVYVFNRGSRAFIRQYAEKFTAPVELNERELGDLGLQDGVLIGYGHQPVMITANCIQKTTGGCRKKDGLLLIKDRRQKKFPVKMCCKYCYNIIYNSLPLYLADKAEEICRLHPWEVRLDFVTETKEEMKRVVRSYERALLHGEKVKIPETEFTRGHFKRGVK